MSKRPAVEYTATQLEDRLALRYRTDAGEVLFGVRNDAGFRADRTCDAVAIGLWPSTGCSLEGFEIKVSRSDWLRELKEGGKSEAFMAYMDFWWLVAPREVVTDDELPPAWGLLVPSGDGLRVARQAKRNDAPVPMPRGMLAALVKRASTAKARAAAIDASYRAGVERGKEQAANGAGWEARAYRELQEKVALFRDRTGIDPANTWNAAELRKVHALVRNGGHVDLAKRLGYAAQNIERLAADLRAAVTQIEGSAIDAEAVA